MVLIQSVSSQISSTLICNSLAGCVASSTVAETLFPPGVPLLHQCGSLLQPALGRYAMRAAQLHRSVSEATELPCQRRSVAAALMAILSASVPTSALAENLAQKASGFGSSVGGYSKADPPCLLCSFYLLPSALGPSHSFPVFASSMVILVFLMPYPFPARNTAVCEHGGNPSPA